ncbi:hypothetical protein [Sedimentibacter sp. LTW-03]
MGSSVRKTSDKIKKLLKDTIDVNPSIECKEVIPQIALETLRSKKTKGYFADKDFAVLAGGGFACFKKAKEIGIDKFLQEYNIQYEKLTVIEVQKIIESILDNIVDEDGEIDSVLILAAFKSAMTSMILNKFEDPAEFLNVFCEKFISMIIREDANEALISMFKDTSAEILNNNIEKFSKNYVKKNFSEIIIKCNSGDIQINELIQKLQDVLKE